MFDALYDGYERGEQAGDHGADEDDDDRRPGRTPVRSITVSGTASDRATPISVPTTMPTTAPNIDTITASQRTDAARLALVHPDRPHQPDLPRPLEHAEGQRDRDAEHGDDDGEAEQHRDDQQQLVDLARLLLAELVVASAPWPAGTAAIAASIAASPCSASTPVGELGDDEEVARGAAPVAASSVSSDDQPVAGQRGVVVDAGDGQRRARSPFWNVTSTRVADLRGRGPRPGPCGRRCRPSARSLAAAVREVDVDELLERASGRRRRSPSRRRRSHAPERHGPAVTADSSGSLAASSATAGGKPWNDSSVTT